MTTSTTLQSLSAVRYFPVVLVAALALACGSSESKQSVREPSNPAEKLSVSATRTDKPAAGTTPTQKPAADTAAPKTVAPVPTIQFSAYDIDGKLHQADEWIGKQPVILNFWGTWCGPCRREIPELIRLYAEYKNKGVEIISIAIRDTPTKVRIFTQQQGMNWIMLMDNRKISYDFRITGVPTSIFINSKGEVIHKFVGPRSYDVFKKAFEAIL